MVASGTFGYGEEFKELVSLKEIGAIVTKTVTTKPWEGNPPPRICETTAGMLNAIGLQNEGVDDFIENRLPFLKKRGCTVIASIAGRTNDEYAELAKRLDKTGVDAIEVNISCPNINSRKQHRLFAQDARDTASVVRAVKQNTGKPVIAKLTPNVADIGKIAKSAQRAGADAVALINTLLGMAVDVNTKMPKLGNITGGLSGPAIKPVALRMVWEVYKSVKIPIIGIGGIMNGTDAVEFLLCGATAVHVGTANFINPKSALVVLGGLKAYMKKNSVKSVKELTGSLKV